MINWQLRRRRRLRGSFREIKRQLRRGRRSSEQMIRRRRRGRRSSKQQAASSTQQEGGEAAKVRLRVLKRPASSKVAEKEWKRSMPTAVPLTRRLKINDSDASIASSDHLNEVGCTKNPDAKYVTCKTCLTPLLIPYVGLGFSCSGCGSTKFVEHASYPGDM